MTPLLSILIPNRSSKPELVVRALASIFKQPLTENDELEVVVVDSSDSFDLKPLKQFPMKLIHSTKPLPCGMARNIAASKAEGKYIWCVDGDDLLAKDCLNKLLDELRKPDAKDFYFLPWMPLSKKGVGAFVPDTFEQLCHVNIAAWNKCYKRELYVDFPDYHPEDVVAHYKLLDKIQNFGSMKDIMYIYDDTNPAAYTRTWDWLKQTPNNIVALALNNTLNKKGLRDEAVGGCLRTAADLYDFTHKATKPEVKKAVIERLDTTWRNIASGYYIH